MSESSTADFKQLQYAFTRHMRDPEHTPAPSDIEDRRVEIYRGLLYRNVESFIANSFPVLRKITDDESWHAMIRDYFKNHQSHTPLFPKMPQEFLQYLENERHDDNDFPFIKELAHYEWVEMAIMLDSRELEGIQVNKNGDLLEGVPLLNPLTWVLAYQYPVHQIGPDFIPTEVPEQPTYLVVYRDEQDDVGFLELNPVSARLLDLIKQDMGKTGKLLLQQIAAELQHQNPDAVIQGGLQIMQQMLEKSVLLGTKS